MLFMVIERFKDQNAKAVYRRFREEGRMMPDGLTYQESWVEANCGRCFQLVECEDITLIQQWVTNWQDVADFEIVPVVDGGDTAAAIGEMLG